MKKRILSVIVAALLILSLLPNAFAASDFASEVPASIDETKTQFEYLLSRGYVGVSEANTEKAASYAQVTNSDAWKFASQFGMENYSFNGGTGITLRTNVSDMGNGANVVFALYIPKAGKYTFEYSSITRDNSGSLDIYFAKCPEDFTVNSAGANLPFAASDKLADDLSFYVGGTNVRGYLALDNVVTVPSAGTYLVAFTDFKTVNGATYSDAMIRQEIVGIRLSETFGGEVPANATIDTEYNYVFGHSYVGLDANADVNGVTSYSKVTNTTATDYWKFAAKSDMANTTLNSGSNGVFINTNSNSAYMVMALYIPSAGKYNVSFDYIKRTDNSTLDMYFAKCPDNFAGSGFPFVASDKIAEDYSFGNGNPWSRGNVLDGVIEVPSAGTYLIGFTDSRINGAVAATNLTLYNIKLTQTFTSEVPARVDATKEKYEYKFGTDKVSTGSDVTLVNSYSKVVKGDYWKFANQSGMSNYAFNGDNGLYLNANSSDANIVIALYVPRAGKYKFEFGYLQKGAADTLDMYLAKCPEDFVVNSAGATLPFDESDKIAEDYLFDNANLWNRDNVLDDVVEIPTAGTYLVGFADFKLASGETGSINQTILNINLTREKEPVVPENPNAEITGNSVSIGLTAIVDGVASADAKALLSESSVTAGNVNSVTVGSTVTLKADETDTLKFLYWYNGNSGRIISDAKEYTFTAGTNTPVFAKYADVNEELTEYFSTAGQLVEEGEGEFGAEPSHTIGDYYKLFKETASEAVHSAVNKIASVANFVYWTKDGKVVSYDETYTYTPWTGNEVVVEVAEGEKSDVPTVVLFENGNARMLELVNFDGIEIIEKGILFGGNLTVSSCAEKAISVESKNQFTASSDETTARAYVIYRDGAVIRVAYSK